MSPKPLRRRGSAASPCACCHAARRKPGYSYCASCLRGKRDAYRAGRERKDAAKPTYQPAKPRKRGPDTDDTRIRHECDVCRTALYDESTRCSYCATLTPAAGGSTLHAERRA